MQDWTLKATLKPKVVCLVGSVDQKYEWFDFAEALTKRGFVVFEAGSYDKEAPKEVWDIVTQVHHRKIELSDVIGVIRKPDGTIGEHTQADIAYAFEKGKTVAKVESIFRGVYADW
jgi:hypothetical protein